MNNEQKELNMEMAATASYPSVPGWRVNRPVTSREAARSVTNMAKKLQADIVKVLTVENLTCHEVAARIRPPEMTDVEFERFKHNVQSRISELRAQGKVVCTDDARPNESSGRAAAVWRMACNPVQYEMSLL